MDLEKFLALFTALRLKVGFRTIFEISCTSDLLNFALLILSLPKRSFWIKKKNVVLGITDKGKKLERKTCSYASFMVQLNLLLSSSRHDF